MAEICAYCGRQAEGCDPNKNLVCQICAVWLDLTDTAKQDLGCLEHFYKDGSVWCFYCNYKMFTQLLKAIRLFVRNPTWEDYMEQSQAVTVYEHHLVTVTTKLNWTRPDRQYGHMEDDG